MLCEQATSKINSGGRDRRERERRETVALDGGELHADEGVEEPVENRLGKNGVRRARLKVPVSNVAT